MRKVFALLLLAVSCEESVKNEESPDSYFAGNEPISDIQTSLPDSKKAEDPMAKEVLDKMRKKEAGKPNSFLKNE